jgi:thioredoxin reductase (NADPH)
MLDVIIVGAGPSGLSIAIEAQKSGMSYVVIEKGGIVNSIQNFPAEMSFFSTPELLEIGGLPFTSAQMRPVRAEGLEYYSRVAEFYKLNCNFFESVISIKKSDNTFSLQSSKALYETRTVVLATGYYDNPNYLNIPGESLSKVSHYYDEPYPFYRQNVVVIGAKNSAAIAALELFRHGANVTLVHRGDSLSDKIKYWIKPDIENRIKEGSIKVFFNTNVNEIKEGSIILQKENQFPIEIKNDFVFALTGYHPNYDFLRSCGIALIGNDLTPILNSDTFETNVADLYVAGSIIAGKNNNSIFIENGRLHGKIIVDSIKKKLDSL